MTTAEIIAARVTKYTKDLLRHFAPSQPDGVCRCDECVNGRHMLSELAYIQMAIRNLDRPIPATLPSEAPEELYVAMSRLRGFFTHSEHVTNGKRHYADVLRALQTPTPKDR